MITLKTTNKHDFLEPYGVNAPKNDYIYLKIDKPEFLNKELVTVKGYYYFKDSNGQNQKLRDIQVTPITRTQIHQMQQHMIPPFGSELVFDLMEYLCEKLAIIVLQQEAQNFTGANYGITGNGDIEIYTPPIEPEEE